jgi:putative Mg2+ transporter-C (MgtC) family protein
VHNLDTLIHDWIHGFGWPTEAITQLLFAAVAGGLVGIEREVRGRQAGFRTNLLVCVGSALVMIVSTRMAWVEWPSHDKGMSVQVSVDPSRIAYGIMTGIGFLGAGTIIKNGSNVRGLTTAASLWCVAALGMAAGVGLYLLVAAATLLMLLALWLLDYASNLLPRVHYREVKLRRRWEPGCVADTVRRLKEAGLKVADAAYERTATLENVDIRLRIAFKDKPAFYAFERHVSGDNVHELLAVSE